MKQLCEIYLRKHTIFVISQSLSEFGIGVSIGPMFKVETNTPQSVGEAVIAALDASRSGISQPDDLGQIQKDLFRFTGTRSWSDLVKTATYVGVTRVGHTVTIMPHRVGPSRAFVPEGNGIACQITDVEGIGLGVLNALKLSDRLSEDDRSP